MKIKNLSESDIIEVVTKVAKNHCNKSFDIYDSDDIQQEVWCICLNIIPKFNIDKSFNQKDIKKALEHFLNTSVANRLTNFYRDKYIVPQKKFKSDKSDFDKQLRTNLKHPLNVQEIVVELNTTPENHAHYTQFLEKIASELDEENIDILEAVLSGEKVNTYFRKRLWKKILSLSPKNESQQD